MDGKSDVFSLGASVNVTQQINVGVSVDNLTNVKGFTEGNPRQGQTQQIVNGLVLTIPGVRNTRAVARVEFAKHAPADPA